ATSARGTSAHAPYATRAPKARRSGARAASTSSTAALAASVPSTSQRSRGSAAVIVQVLDQAAQLIDVGLAQPAALAEMRDQRRHAATEQAVEHRLALAGHPGLAGQDRGVEIPAPVALGAHGALPEQPVQ